MEQEHKNYVVVKAQFDPLGNILPLSLTWRNGIEYEVDRVLDVRKAASLKAGGIGTRYIVRIRNKERLLWLEENRWFVEN